MINIKNAKNFFTDDKFGIIENKNHDLDEVINKLKDEKINIYEAVVTKELER